jgi:CheY-like chemotaxis protein
LWEEEEITDFRVFRMLLIDDSITSCKFLAHKLRSKSFDVVMSNSSVDALHLVQNEFFDLVISDVSMPKVDGIELLRLCWPNISTYLSLY